MEGRFPAELVQTLWQGFGTVQVEGIDALDRCTVAVRAPGGAVAGEGILESGHIRKVTKKWRENPEQPDLAMGTVPIVRMR